MSKKQLLIYIILLSAISIGFILWTLPNHLDPVENLNEIVIAVIVCSALIAIYYKIETKREK